MHRIILTTDNLDTALEAACQVLAGGGLVVYPTETMYGVGADALNPEAVATVLAFKNRPAGKPVSVLVFNAEQAADVVELNDTARGLYESFLPGPVTVVSRDRGTVDPRLVSELGTLGIRISSHPVAAALAASYGRPISATSANASGKARPYSIETMLAGLSQRQISLIDLVLDAGDLPRNEPSTVIDTTTEIQEVLRAGASFAEIAPPSSTTSEAETVAHAFGLMRSLLHVLPEKAVVFALEGEMGVGKTRFAKGVAEALGVTQVVSSPTYTIMKEYTAPEAKLVHIDCWRLGEGDIGELGMESYLVPGTVLVVEWAGPLLPLLRSRATDIVAHHAFIDITSEESRLIRVGAL